MGEAHNNVVRVQKYVQKYYQINGHGCTAPDLHRYMKDWVDISEPTVRACLETLEEEGVVDKTEVSKTDFYIIDESMLPQPEESDMYSDSDQFW